MRTGSDHFDPKTWRFGLHNRAPNSLQTDGTERFKIQVARALRLTGNRWNAFCKDVVVEEKSHWEAVYGQSPDAKLHSIADIRCLLALDALFLVIWMQMMGGGIERLSPPLHKVMGTQVMSVHLIDLCWSDFYLVENQIPMVLLERVVGILKRRGWKFIEAWEHKQWQGWNIENCVQCSRLKSSMPFKRDLALQNIPLSKQPFKMQPQTQNDNNPQNPQRGRCYAVYI
jgi:hypothetical protein